MLQQLSIAIRATVLSVIALGLLYPIAMTGVIRAIVPAGPNPDLIGQSFTKPQYFWGRPSAAGKGYDPTATSGTNLGPTSKKLMDATRATIAALEKADPAAGAPPMDLVTSSASGIDPDISPAAAYYQVARVAKARGLDPAAVRAIVARSVRERTLGFLGEPRVNVLDLNRALDAAR
ncbi:MAG TPA: potassium-transporting ATPase subunit C [Candidatus Baltobacteraceae bacterium]|jgi:K+-transporting ATPase ATPase C chain